MMNKEQQDLAWACLPSKCRTEIKTKYHKLINDSKEYYKNGNNYGHHVTQYEAFGIADAFGERNLTSDAESEEMLMVERRKVIEIYNPEYDGETLYELFGDKCLPDKEEPKPKFGIGQKVVMKLNGSIRKISSRKYTPKGYQYFFEGYDYADYSFEQGMESYTEENKEAMGESTKREGWDKAFKEYAEKDEDDKLLPDYLDSEAIKALDQEKELNLLELLKGHEDETFYSPVYGNVVIDFQEEYGPIRMWPIPKDAYLPVTSKGHHSDNPNEGCCILWPSKELYEKYPLDAYSAWMEWKESRKPKYVLQAELRLISNDVKTVEDYENIEVEMSDIDLSTAAEAVREALQKFYEQH